MKKNSLSYRSNIVPLKPSNDNLKHSNAVSLMVLEELISKVLKDLPPDPKTLLKYSGIVVKKTTQKLVDVNMLQSQIVPSQSDFQQSPEKCQNEQSLIRSSQMSQKSKKSNYKKDDYENKSQQQNRGQKQFFKPFKISKPHKIKQDEQILLKKDGIKFLKKQQLKNLIKHRTANSHNSLYFTSSNLPTCQKIKTKKSLYDCEPTAMQKDKISENYNPNQQINNKNNNFSISGEGKHLLNKGARSFSTLPGVNKNSGTSGADYQKDRISGVLNQTQLVNLREYYKNKEDQKPPRQNLLRRLNSSIANPFSHNRNIPSNFSTLVQQSATNDPSSWLNELQDQTTDEDDMIINKLRERKQKFSRTGVNYSNGESYVNTRRQNPLILNPGQKGNPQNTQMGGMMAFDYSGQVLPTFKYDTMKMQPHYQDMDFSISENDESFAKKKQRKGHMFRAAINLKLVDHQRFIPHPNYKFESLVEKPGMLMKQSASCVLKKGVEVRSKEQNATISNSAILDTEQTRERINKTAFQFLYNQELGANKVKYQQFLRFKKGAQSGSSLHKNTSSRKKLFDLTNQRQESLLSKKSIMTKGMKGKQSSQQDANNKVYKSENRKALELLINANNLIGHQFENGKDENIQQLKQGEGAPINGVLKKNNLHSHAKSLSNNADKSNSQLAKKKVRIA